MQSQNLCLPDGGAPSILSAAYWRRAAGKFTSLKGFIFAALIVALRVVVKAFRIPLVPGMLYLTMDCYINSLGSVVYGPLMALLVGAVSDTLGAFIFPSGPYFFPFIFVEMLSGFLFALFFWERRLSVPRAILAKFTVNLLCNIILNSALMKVYYLVLYDNEKTYVFFNLTRIAKNLVLFPLEAILICVVLGAFLPVLRQMKLVPREQAEMRPHAKDVVLAVVLALVSVGLILFYLFFLKDFIASHNIKFG